MRLHPGIMPHSSSEPSLPGWPRLLRRCSCEKRLRLRSLIMNREKAIQLLNVYGKAWVTRDPDLIVTIFTEDATYNDPHEPEHIGRDAIRSYWMSKVVG